MGNDGCFLPEYRVLDPALWSGRSGTRLSLGDSQAFRTAAGGASDVDFVINERRDISCLDELASVSLYAASQSSVAELLAASEVSYGTETGALAPARQIKS